MAMSTVGVIHTHSDTSRLLIAAYMLLAGLGLGFVMPNLTVFAQQNAGRKHLGIATALLQSLRMIGGMAGTAVVGTIVNNSYIAGVRDSLRQNDAQQWFPQLKDPQILVNPAAHEAFLKQAHGLGRDGGALIDGARLALVDGIHHGQFLALAVSLIALWCVWRMPRVQLSRRAAPAGE